MKKITKSLMTLALLVVGVLNANAGEETVIKSIDYTADPVLIDGVAYEKSGYPFYRMGDCNGTASFDVVDGVLKINNTKEQSNNWDLQPFIIDWFSLKEQYGYKIVISMKADVAGTANLSVGTWSVSNNAEVAFEASTEFVEYTGTIKSSTVESSGDCHVLFQMGKVVGTVEIASVTVIEVTPDEPIKEPVWKDIINNGDLEGEGTKNFIVTQHGAGGGRAVAAIVEGVGKDGSNGITMQSSGKETNGWDSQFFIFFNKKISSGTKVNVKFDYKAKKEASVSTQVHGTPGGYIGNCPIGTLNFTTEWQTYEKAITVSNNDVQSFAFNMADNTKLANIYYFDNFVVQVDEDVLATLEDSDIESYETKEQEVLPEDPLIAVKNGLSNAIAQGKLFTNYKKTEESFAVLTSAISDGEAALEAADATEESLNTAKAAIDDAIDGLTYEEGITKLTAAMFHRYASVDADAEVEEENQGCSYDLGKNSGLPYGDGAVSERCWADLSKYDKLVVVAAEGTPRFCINRLVAGGQQAETQADSKMLDINPNNTYTWSTEKYQTKDGNIFTIDLKAIVEDYGFARLHCIKGANYGNATVIDWFLTEAPQVETIALTVTEAGYATFAPAKDVTVPEGVKAYTAVLSKDQKSVALTEVTEIPAGTGVVIEAAEGDYDFEVIAEAAAVGDNELVVSDGTLTGNYYVLTQQEGKVGFAKIAAGFEVPAGKVCLDATAAARDFLEFEFNTTGISIAKAAEAEGAIFNLAGQRVAKAQKGLFIQNGKKVIVK